VACTPKLRPTTRRRQVPAAVPFLREAGALAQLGTVKTDQIVPDPIATDRPVTEWDWSTGPVLIRPALPAVELRCASWKPAGMAWGVEARKEERASGAAAQDPRARERDACRAAPASAAPRLVASCCHCLATRAILCPGPVPGCGTYARAGLAVAPPLPYVATGEARARALESAVAAQPRARELKFDGCTRSVLVR
jgi:hypothetical protein